MSHGSISLKSARKKSLVDFSSAKEVDYADDNLWVRPSEWPALTVVGEGEQKFVGLFAVYDHDMNYLAFQFTGNYTVDWGDGGATENVASGVNAYHQYTYSSIAGSPISRGYKIVQVTVTPNGGNLTAFNMQVKHNATGLNAYNAPWLDVTICGSNFTSIKFGQATTVALTMLENIRVQTNGITTSSWNMFNACTGLQNCVITDSSGWTDLTSMWTGCTKLKNVIIPDVSAVTYFNSAFLSCISLKNAPNMNAAGGANGCASMFQNCYSLKNVPDLNMASCTNFASMFSGCTSLEKAPFINTEAGTTFTSMFQGCFALKTVQLYKISPGTNINLTSMFYQCYSLVSVPAFDTSTVTNFSNMFFQCFRLESVPNLNTSAGTNFTQMFYQCTALRSPLPSFDVSLGTAFGGMFNGCTSLEVIPDLNFAAGTIGGGVAGMLYNLPSMQITPTINLTNVTASNDIIYTSPSVSKINLYNIKYTIYFTSFKLSATELVRVFKDNFTKSGTPGSTTANIGSNPGSGNIFSKASSGTTSGSTTITMSNTSSMAAGQLVRGTGISDARAVTFTDAGDLVNRTAHGIPSGTPVSFASITSTTGIVTYTVYYVVNANADDFQVSDTIGGAAKALTTNGSGTLLCPTKIVAVTLSTSITTDIPASATGSVTLTIRDLDTSWLFLKGHNTNG